VSGKIDRIIAENLNGVIDVEDSVVAVTYAEETQFLKSEVQRLVDGLYGPPKGAHENVLADKLRAFANS